MSNHDERIELEGVPGEEGVSEANAADELASSSEEKRNFTETHPERARKERARAREDTPDR